LKALKEKQGVTYKATPIRMTADLSTQTLTARRAWNDIFHTLKETVKLD
jgi:hypothetical protein